jgi:branched-chain amino acid transport system substrate-binding protein
VDVTIGIDLRARRQAAKAVRQMHAAVRLILERHRGRAGEMRVRLLRDEAASLAANPRVVAMLGTFRSAHAAAALPTINRYALPTVSPSNTYVPLTSPAPAFEPDEPARFYPDGRRTYVRLFPNDFHQAAALAQTAAVLGVRRAFVLHDGAPYGLAIAEGFRRAAPVAGLALAGVELWEGDVFERVEASEADGVVLCGVIGHRAQHLLREKVRRLGPNSASVKLLAPDGFLTRELGEAAEGALVLGPGLRPGHLPEAAERWVDAFRAHLGIERQSVEPYAIHAAEAVELLLEAIAGSDASRAGIVQRLFDGRRRSGLLGEYTIAPSGDVIAPGGPLLGFSVYRADTGGVLLLERAVLPRADLVAAAFGQAHGTGAPQ